tara:strand:+ start:209 stop:532 length:324 start_codon:yes stop_codon:yes gene_type:complete
MYTDVYGKRKQLVVVRPDRMVRWAHPIPITGLSDRVHCSLDYPSILCRPANESSRQEWQKSFLRFHDAHDNLGCVVNSSCCVLCCEFFHDLVLEKRTDPALTGSVRS